MGPASLKWYTDRGIDHTKEYWYAGRIDIRGVEDEPYGLEYGLAVMDGESWGRFSEFLRSLTTKEVWEYDKLIEEFEKHHKIRWWNDEANI